MRRQPLRLQIPMIDAYGPLAQVYDRFTKDVDYDALYHYLRQLLAGVNAAPTTVLDLACGTGSISMRFAADGCQVIGADLSEEMLTVAMDKASTLDHPPFFIHQPMQRLRLPQPVELCVCLLDSLNYLTEAVDLRDTFAGVYRTLQPGGWFLFDVRTPSLLRSLDGQVFLDEDEEAYCVWRGSFDEESNVLTYAMDIFTRQGRLWRREQEQHEERAWDTDWLVRELQVAGFTNIRQFGNRSTEAPARDEERIFYLARKDLQ